MLLECTHDLAERLLIADVVGGAGDGGREFPLGIFGQGRERFLSGRIALLIEFGLV